MLVFGVFLSCSSGRDRSTASQADTLRHDTCDCNIHSIRVLFYTQIFNSARALGWNDLYKRYETQMTENVKGLLLKDSIITECSTLKAIEAELQTLRMSNESFSSDARMAITVVMKDKSVKEYCIGGIYSDGFYPKEYKSARFESDNTNKLIFLIKKEVGYYTFVDPEYLNYMDELKDDSLMAVIRPYIELNK